MASPGPYAQIFFHFWTFLVIFYEYYSFSLIWDPMEAKIPKRYSYKSQPKIPNFSCMHFLSNGPQKTTFGIFEILKILILINFIRFVTMGPN